MLANTIRRDTNKSQSTSQSASSTSSASVLQQASCSDTDIEVKTGWNEPGFPTTVTVVGGASPSYDVHGFLLTLAPAGCTVAEAGSGSTSSVPAVGATTSSANEPYVASSDPTVQALTTSSGPSTVTLYKSSPTSGAPEMSVLGKGCIFGIVLATFVFCTAIW